MFTGTEITEILENLQITHVVWLPDSTLGPWEHALESSSKIKLVRICREGEAWTLAAGLTVGGKAPLIMMQSTGFYESGDAMRNVVFDLQLPVFAIVGVRNWLEANANDSAKRFAKAIIDAWGIRSVWIETDRDKHQLAEHYTRCQATAQAGLVLMAEGKG